MAETSEPQASVAGGGRAGVRVAAVVALMFWWVGLFGIIDLSVPFDRPVDPAFFPWYMLETGWGLLYTVLLGLPTLILLWRPASFDLAVQLVVVALAFGVVPVVTPDSDQLLPSLLAGGLGVAVPALTARTLRPPPGYLQLPTGTAWLTAALVVSAAVPAVRYAGDMIDAARAGATAADSTLGIDHGPAQAGAALAWLLVAAQAVLAPASRVPAWSVSICAMWFGALSIAYPEHFGSAGAFGGRLLLAWGGLFAVSHELTAWRRRTGRRGR